MRPISWLRDLRYGARGLARAPGFTAVTVLILALGIGANSTMFTLVSSLFLEPPPGVSEPDRLVRITRANERTSSGSLSYPDYLYYRENNSVLSGLAASSFRSVDVMLHGDFGDMQAEAMLVSGNYFDVLGVRPALGRDFLPEEADLSGARPVAIISHGLWTRALGADPQIVGRELELNGERFSVIGVAPEAFRDINPLGTAPDLWTPIALQPAVLPTGSDMLRRVPGERQVWLQGIARLAEGVGLEAARSNLSALARQLEENYREWNEGQGIAVNENFQYVPAVRSRLIGLTRLLVSVTAMILLIACANLAILLLARASTRERELGVRRALGAGRGQVVRLLVTEGLVLAALGGLAGLTIAAWISEAAAALLPVSLQAPVRPNAGVVAFTLILCLLTTLLFALAPAWTVSRADVADVMRGAGRVTRSSPLRSTLVVVQIGLAIVLVSGAALFLRSFATAQSVDVGFEIEDRAIVSFNLRPRGYSEEEGQRFIRDALARVQALPGVESATTTRMVPFGGGVWTGGFEAEGVEPPAGEEAFDAGFNAVGPDYFRTLGIPILAGRGFTESDDARAPPVVVVNQALADMVWPGESPLGKVVGRGADYRFTVVGLARDANYYDLGEDPQPQLYLAVLQYYQPRVNLVAKAGRDAADLIRPIRAELRSLDSQLIISGARTLEEVFADTLGSYRVLATLVSVFGALALLLAAVGLYGVLSYLVSQRTRELGVRIALGARRPQVVGLVLGRGLRLAVLGVVGGAVIAWSAAWAVRGFLFGITPHDPVSFVAVPFMLMAVAALAAYLPARRAASIDPMQAIRHE